MATIKNVTIIGGGLMGSGIAQVTAAANFNVTLVEINDKLAEKSKENIKKNLHRFGNKKFPNNPHQLEEYIKNALDHLTTTSDLISAVKNADLIIEAIIENLSAKHKLFKQIDKEAPKHTIFVSNTSSLLISEIASCTSSERKVNFGGLHFFSPVPLMRLVEIIRITETNDQVYEQLKIFAQAIGKTSITCKDTPGFVVNSLLIPYSLKAMKLFDDGVASARDIDIGMKLGAGYPMGPIELADNVGLDVCYSIIKGWHDRDPTNDSLKPSTTLVRLIEQGKLGVKTGEGFYNYKN